MKQWIMKCTAALAVSIAFTAGAQVAPQHLAHAAAGDAAVPRAGSAAIAPLAHTLPFKGQYMIKRNHCAPAAAQMVLSTFGIKVDQATLAKKMGTTTSGTSWKGSMDTLNMYVKPRGYKFTLATDVAKRPLTLMSRLSHDIGVLRRATDLAVWPEKLPWNEGKEFPGNTGHLIVAYGYNSLKGTVTIFDPSKPTGGSHTIAVTTLARAFQTGFGMRDISRL
ncbi:C39 family peptidase [Nonomuraea sp. KM88]|uniref:C39 family peptidase n=1 Tax=Nonomuraea sp. KM88 TaxID=3457427 RepID=UPI003FCE41E3